MVSLPNLVRIEINMRQIALTLTLTITCGTASVQASPKFRIEANEADYRAAELFVKPDGSSSINRPSFDKNGNPVVKKSKVEKNTETSGALKGGVTTVALTGQPVKVFENVHPFCLPKQRGVLKIIYSVYSVVDTNPEDISQGAGEEAAKDIADLASSKEDKPAQFKFYVARVETPVEMSLESVPDSKLAFVAVIDRGLGLFADTAKLNVTSQNGIITGVNAHFVDQTGPIITDLARTGMNIAMAAVAAGATKLPSRVYKFEKKVTVSRSVELDQFKSIEEEDKTRYPGRFASDEIAQEKIKDQNDFYQIWQELDNPSTTFSKDIRMPDLIMTSDKPVLTTVTASQLIGDSGHYDGIITRVPSLTRLRVKSVDPLSNRLVSLVMDTKTLLAQTGGFEKIPIKGKLFSDRNFEIQISTATGNITSINVSGTSQIKAITQMLKEISGMFNPLGGK